MIYAKNLKARIEELEAQLTEVTAYFDDLRTELNEQIKIRVQENTRAETYRGAIPRAYAMALEAAAVSVEVLPEKGNAGPPQDGVDRLLDAQRRHDANAIRALTPPADLVERVLKTKETDK